MPNWVKNIVRFIGDDESIEKLKKFIVVDDEHIKQLEERNSALSEDFQIKIPEKGKISFNILIPQPTNIFQGGVGKKEEEKYGKNTWYDWNIEHWGTKWDACECEVYQTRHYLELSFWTAWSCPEPWYKAICEKAVEIGDIVSIDGEFADEDFGGFMAYIEYDFGENELVIAGSDYDRELYELVWGEGTCDFEDEDSDESEPDTEDNE